MSWVNNFAKGTHSLFAGQTLEGLQPIAFTEFWPMFYDLWVTKTVTAIKKLGIENKSYTEIKHLLPTPSNIRILNIKLVLAYGAMPNKNKEEIKFFAEFFARMAREAGPDDPYCEFQNKIHTPGEISTLLESIDLEPADVQKAKMFGRLNTALGSMVHGLYNDFTTDLGWDVYGPYVVPKDNVNHSFLIRHFPDMSPTDLGWRQDLVSSVKEIKMYALYEGVDWLIKTVGCHTMPISGSPVHGMRYFAVVADGKKLSLEEIEALINNVSGKAENIYKEIRNKDFEALKSMILLQECFQLKKIFDAADMDWCPDQKIIDRIQNKPLTDPVLPKTEFMETLEDYIEKFGIRKFAKEVLEEKI